MTCPSRVKSSEIQKIETYQTIKSILYGFFGWDRTLNLQTSSYSVATNGHKEYFKAHIFNESQDFFSCTQFLKWLESCCLHLCFFCYPLPSPFPMNFGALRKCATFLKQMPAWECYQNTGLTPQPPRNTFKLLLIENVNNISQCTSNIFIPLLCPVPSCSVFYLSCLIKYFLLWFKILPGIFSSDFNLRDSDSLRFVFLPVVFWYQCCLKCGFQHLPLHELSSRLVLPFSVTKSPQICAGILGIDGFIWKWVLFV